MVFGELERRATELRYIDGIEKVEHVPFQIQDEFWVRFNRPLDMKKMRTAVKSNGGQVVKFGGLPSKLPRKLSEVLWSGVTHVILKKCSEFEKIGASLGFEPPGIAKIVRDLHGPYQIYIANNEDGIHILYDYLGLKYVPPAPPPPPKVAAPPPKPAPAAAKPTSAPTTPPKPAPTIPGAAPKPATPATPTASSTSDKKPQ